MLFIGTISSGEGLQIIHGNLDIVVHFSNDIFQCCQKD